MGKAASQLGQAQGTEGPSRETKVYADFWEIAEALAEEHCGLHPDA